MTVDVTPLETDNVFGSVPKSTDEIELLLFEVKTKFLSLKVIPPDKVKVPLLVEFPSVLEFWTTIAFPKVLAVELLEDNVPPFNTTLPVPNALLAPAAIVPAVIVVWEERFDELSTFKTKVPFPVFVTEYEEEIICASKVYTELLVIS